MGGKNRGEYQRYFFESSNEGRCLARASTYLKKLLMIFPTKGEVYVE